jgi:hypothetical protein
MFDCPNGDGTCTTGDDVTVALLDGEVVVGGQKLISVFFPQGIDFATAEARPIEFALDRMDERDPNMRRDVRMWAGLSLADVTRSPELAEASGIIATCSCGHRWIYG